MNPVKVANLRRAYEAALRRECRAVDALPDRGATEAQIKRCWDLADATNRALRTLNVARGAEQPGQIADGRILTAAPDRAAKLSERARKAAATRAAKRAQAEREASFTAANRGAAWA